MDYENKVTWFSGPCHLQVCYADIPHGHLTCPVCNSVTFRNPECLTCRMAWGMKCPDEDRVPMQSVTDVRLIFRSVTCPKCSAKPGQKCRNYRDATTIEHRKRVMAVVLLRNDFGWRTGA